MASTTVQYSSTTVLQCMTTGSLTNGTSLSLNHLLNLETKQKVKDHMHRVPIIHYSDQLKSQIAIMKEVLSF